MQVVCKHGIFQPTSNRTSGCVSPHGSPAEPLDVIVLTPIVVHDGAMAMCQCTRERSLASKVNFSHLGRDELGVIANVIAFIVAIIWIGIIRIIVAIAWILVAIGVPVDRGVLVAIDNLHHGVSRLWVRSCIYHAKVGLDDRHLAIGVSILVQALDGGGDRIPDVAKASGHFCLIALDGVFVVVVEALDVVFLIVVEALDGVIVVEALDGVILIVVCCCCCCCCC